MSIGSQLSIIGLVISTIAIFMSLFLYWKDKKNNVKEIQGIKDFIKTQNDFVIKKMRDGLIIEIKDLIYQSQNLAKEYHLKNISDNGVHYGFQELQVICKKIMEKIENLNDIENEMPDNLYKMSPLIEKLRLILQLQHNTFFMKDLGVHGYAHIQGFMEFFSSIEDFTEENIRYTYQKDNIRILLYTRTNGQHINASNELKIIEYAGHIISVSLFVPSQDKEDALTPTEEKIKQYINNKITENIKTNTL